MRRRPLVVAGKQWEHSVVRTADGGLLVREYSPQGEWSVILDAAAAQSLDLPGTRLAWRRVEAGEFAPLRLAVLDDHQRILAVLGWELDHASSRPNSAGAVEISGRLVLHHPDGAGVARHESAQPGSLTVQLRRIEF